MKKVLMAVSVLFVSAALCSAQSFSVGGHIAFPMGGDVESGVIGFGVQGSLPLAMVHENLSVEAAFTHFGDEDSEDGWTAEATANVLAATAIFKFPLEGIPVIPYVGAGLSYLMLDADVSADLTEEDREVLEALAEQTGLSQQEILEELGLGDRSLDLDNTIAFHFCGGATVQITDTIKAFGEYRYTLGKMKGDIEDDYNFGLLKAGVVIEL